MGLKFKSYLIKGLRDEGDDDDEEEEGDDDEAYGPTWSSELRKADSSQCWFWPQAADLAPPLQNLR